VERTKPSFFFFFFFFFFLSFERQQQHDKNNTNSQGGHYEQNQRFKSTLGFRYWNANLFSFEEVYEVSNTSESESQEGWSWTEY